MGNYSEIASRINEHVKMLKSQGVSDPNELFNQMASYLPGLHVVWNNTSDAEFFSLSDRYPYFKQYCVVVEELYEQERQRPDKAYEGLDKFSDDQKAMASQVLSSAAQIEQTLLSMTTGQLNASSKQISSVQTAYQEWRNATQALNNQLKNNGVQDATLDYVDILISGIDKRIQKMMTELK